MLDIDTLSFVPGEQRPICTYYFIFEREGSVVHDDQIYFISLQDAS